MRDKTEVLPRGANLRERGITKGVFLMRFNLILLSLVLLFLMFASPAQSAEPWSAQGCGIQDWQQSGQDFKIRAYSCGLVWEQSFSRDAPLLIEAKTRCSPGTSHNRCWAGVKIGNIAFDRDDDAPCEYGNINVAYHVWSPAIENTVSLVNCSPRYHGEYAPGTWHVLKIVAEPDAGDYVYYNLFVDGARQARIRGSIHGDLVPKLECVSAVRSGPSDGSLAQCDFESVRIAIPGDANCSGRLDSFDALAVLRQVSGLSTEQCSGDINQDGQTDAVDALLILRLVAGL